MKSLSAAAVNLSSLCASLDNLNMYDPKYYSKSDIQAIPYSRYAHNINWDVVFIEITRKTRRNFQNYWYLPVFAIYTHCLQLFTRSKVVIIGILRALAVSADKEPRKKSVFLVLVQRYLFQKF